MAHKRSAKLKKRANRVGGHERALSSLLSKAKLKAPETREGTPEALKGARRGATLSLYESGVVTKALAEPEPPKHHWQARLLAKRFPKCTPEQIDEALDCYDGDTDKAGIICERQSRNAALGGAALSAKDEPLTMEELELLDSKQLAQLAKKLRFNVSGNANELRMRLAALVGLTPDVMVRLEWILDATLPAKLSSIDREGAAIIRSHVAEGRFTAIHYITMFTERLRISDKVAIAAESDEEAEPEPEPEPEPEEVKPDTPPEIADGALRREVYKNLRKARCGKRLRMRTRLTYAAKLRGAGTLALGSMMDADSFSFGFGLEEDANEAPLGSTRQRTSQLLQVEDGGSDDGSSDDEGERFAIRANRTDDPAARRKAAWRQQEREADGWFTAPTTSWSADGIAALGRKGGGGNNGLAALVVPRGRVPPASPPGDNPSSPPRPLTALNSTAHSLSLDPLVANVDPEKGLLDPDLELWRADIQRRRHDAGKVAWQLTRQLPDLDLKPVWLAGVDGATFTFYERLAAANRNQRSERFQRSERRLEF